MKAKADDVAISIQEWFKDAVKSAPASAQELGKFCFGVSASTVGALVAFEKIDTSSKVTLMLGVALLLQALSIITSLLLVLPQKVRLEQEQNLLIHYSRSVKKIVFLSWVWFFLWSLGSIMGIYHAIFL